jgi:hypothetical protein
MPSIYDNLSEGSRLAPALREALKAFDSLDVATGYFDLRGWSTVADVIDSKITPGDRSAAGLRLRNQRPRESVAGKGRAGETFTGPTHAWTTHKE